MEQHTHEESDEQRHEFSREEGNGLEDTDVRTEIMNREQREKALAWAQAYRLIRGGVDEVVQIVEASQYTIELLLQTLRESACQHCESARQEHAGSCSYCQRREELLSQLA